MALFKRGLPRRAVAGAFVGFLYGLLVMPTGFATGSNAVVMAGVGWALLSVALLFGRPFSYYVFLAWALLWIAWKGVLAFRGQGGHPLGVALDIIVPLLALALLSSSGYLESAQREPPP